MGNPGLIILVPPLPMVFWNIIWKCMYSWIIHEPISLVALQNLNDISTTGNEITSFVICTIWPAEKFEWYVVMETTKYRSVTKQTQNNSFYMNWPTGDVEGMTVYTLVEVTHQYFIGINVVILVHIYTHEYTYVF